jgi:hypothetical protein
MAENENKQLETGALAGGARKNGAPSPPNKGDAVKLHQFS